MKTTPIRENDGYLGCLGVIGSMALYGYFTNCRLKIIVALKTVGRNEYKDSSIIMVSFKFSPL